MCYADPFLTSWNSYAEEYGSCYSTRQNCMFHSTLDQILYVFVYFLYVFYFLEYRTKYFLTRLIYFHKYFSVDLVTVVMRVVNAVMDMFQIIFDNVLGHTKRQTDCAMRFVCP